MASSLARSRLLLPMVELLLPVALLILLWLETHRSR
jgi:hypothetical protein